MINNAALAAMFKELVVNELFRTFDMDLNNVADINRYKKTDQYERGLIGLITQIQTMNNDQAVPLFNNARQIYHDVARQVLANQVNAPSQREARTAQRIETYNRRIADMRGDRQIDRIQFAERPQYHYSHSRRRDRARPPPSPEDSILQTPQRPP